MLIRGLFALLCCVLASPAWAVVTYDTQTTDVNAGGDATTSFTHTIGAGTNVYVGVCVGVRGTAGVDVTDVTIDGVTATPRFSQQSGGDTFQIEYWDRVLGSTTGAVTITATTSEADIFHTAAFSMFGVDQTTPSTGHGGATASGTSVTDDVTSRVGDLVVNCLETTLTGISDVTPGANQTERWADDNGADTLNEGSTEPGQTTVTMSYSWTGTATAVMVDANVRAATTRRPIAPIFFQ